ncbi:uncharacterized protein LOC113414342 [Notechis scutatus]|uniref:Uncharacterized protein LOC113414342 n=1 Tax=Notechis scutatus TaxID=8663 RepID=A0A6J1UGL5_9SAUR|nr:uncharacterized protein LOC113414342 [Notechis scutatus]
MSDDWAAEVSFNYKETNEFPVTSRSPTSGEEDWHCTALFFFSFSSYFLYIAGYPSSPGQLFPDTQLDGYQSKEELFYIPYKSAKLYITKIVKDMHQMKIRYVKVIKELEHVGKESQVTENRETEMNAREIKSDTITQNGQGCFVVDIEEIQDYLPEKKFLLEVKTNLEQVRSSLQKRETELKDLLQTEHWCNLQITETEMMQ